MSQDFAIIFKYGMKINELKADAETFFKEHHLHGDIHNNRSHKNKNQLSTKQKRMALKRAIRLPPGKGVKPSEIDTLWVKTWHDVMVGEYAVNTFILFKDGTAYVRCNFPPNELNTIASKELQPKQWTKWRKSFFSYQIYNTKKQIWKSLKGDKVVKSTPNEKLNAKFITANGSALYGSHKRWISFKPDGRFELSRSSVRSSAPGSFGPSTLTSHNSDKTGSSNTSVFDGKHVGGGTATTFKDGSKNTGNYFLNEYSVTLKHDNDYQHTELFYFDDSDKKSFIYKSDRYWIDK